MNLPSKFEEKMRELLREDFDAYIACFEEPRHYGLRVNTGKISVREFQRICPFEMKPIPWIDNGFYYDREAAPAKHPYYFAGLYYLQEPSAMTPANRLPVNPGDRILDLCAAPGGKATELGARLKGRGILVANDISSSRAKGLLKNLEMFGIGNMFVLSEEPGRLAGYFPEYFDKILIDAPCSGEGMFRKEHRMIKAWEEHGPEYFCPIQKRIIVAAASMLKQGGMLLYSTCTFDSRENEQVIEHLLNQCPEFEILDMAPYEGFVQGMPEYTVSREKAYQKTVRIFPHRMKGEGHYLALLRKGGTQKEDPPEKTRKKRIEPPQEFLRFFDAVAWKLDVSRLDIRGGRIYYMPQEARELGGIRFLRTGLLLGEAKKNRFEPSQALAMSLKKDEYAHCIDFSADDERLIRYLKGETIELPERVDCDAKGWHLICVDGYPLGWGKLSGGILKNKYLPGWRLCV